MIEFDEAKYSKYFQQVKTNLMDLLEQRKNSAQLEEGKLQTFFEKHPSSLLSCLNNTESPYQVFGNCIITQPILKSNDGDRKPDFLVVTWDSLNLYFNFIEIEDPVKKIFKENKLELTPEFHQAYGQLKQWQSFSKNEIEMYVNSLLDTLFKENFNNTPDKAKTFNFILLYGFGSEVQQQGERFNQLLKSYFPESNSYHYTYSRLLRTIRSEAGIFTVKKNHELNKFYATYCTPFSSYGPSEWSELHNIKNKIEVIQSHSEINASDKNKLALEINRIDNMSLKEIHQIMFDNPGLQFI